jgi:hypothetical protein
VRPLHNVFIAAAFAAFVPASAIGGVSPSATVVGTVTLTAADGGTFAGEGARVVLACETDRTARTEVADEHGMFRFLSVPVDSCSIEAEVQGFDAQPVSVVTAADRVVATNLHLGIAPLRVGVNVGGTAFLAASKGAAEVVPVCRRSRARAVGEGHRDRQRRRGLFLKEGCCHVTSND